MAIEPARKHAFGYVRASTSKQKDSPEIQKEQIAKYFEYRLKPQGFTFVHNYEDKATTTKINLRNRSEGFKLDAELEKGDAAIFTKLDRGFRNTADCANVVEAWHRRGIQLHVLDLNIDTATSMGRAMIGMASVFAALERDRIGERQRDSQAYRRSKGLYTSGHPPYGTKIVGLHATKDRPSSRRLVPDPEWRAMGKLIVRLHETDKKRVKVAVKVVDIFGNDTMTIVDVSLKR
jgi:DNA invertase Pin-like site-specific DNA recombinase